MPLKPVLTFSRRSGLRGSIVLAVAGVLSPLSICRAQMHATSDTAPAPPLATAALSTSSSNEPAPAPNETLAAQRTRQDDAGHPFSQSIGIELHTGINGAGVDVALPIARRLNVRIGGQYLRYTGDFSSSGAQIHAVMQVGNGKAGVDWFPFRNGFRLSPQFYFANQTDVQGTVLVPPGQTITLDGQDYVSSATDPLTGSARVSTRKLAPGFTVGWGNLSPRGRKHISFPVELGFFYIGQPKLDVTFKGSACDPSQPPAIGCQSVTADASFQRDLARFIDRNNNNLKYAAFFPVAQAGFGYRF